MSIDCYACICVCACSCVYLCAYAHGCMGYLHFTVLSYTPCTVVLRPQNRDPVMVMAMVFSLVCFYFISMYELSNYRTHLIKQHGKHEQRTIFVLTQPAQITGNFHRGGGHTTCRSKTCSWPVRFQLLQVPVLYKRTVRLHLANVHCSCTDGRQRVCSIFRKLESQNKTETNQRKEKTVTIAIAGSRF